jgi:hypothetical protein
MVNPTSIFDTADTEAMEGGQDFDETFGRSNELGSGPKGRLHLADMIDSSSQASSTQTSTITWIVSSSRHLLHCDGIELIMQNWYTSLPGHDYFCEVMEDFIEDDFNLTGE